MKEACIDQINFNCYIDDNDYSILYKVRGSVAPRIQTVQQYVQTHVQACCL
jgi:hypothetical protein